MLGVSFHELLRAVPQGRNGLDIFVQAEHETVLLVVVLHDPEWILMNIAEELDARLDSPVVLELHHQGMTEEEARFKTAHMTITDGIAIDDLPSTHVFANRFSLLLINPRWE